MGTLRGCCARGRQMVWESRPCRFSMVSRANSAISHSDTQSPKAQMSQRSDLGHAVVMESTRSRYLPGKKSTWQWHAFQKGSVVRGSLAGPRAGSWLDPGSIPQELWRLMRSQ